MPSTVNWKRACRSHQLSRAAMGNSRTPCVPAKCMEADRTNGQLGPAPRHWLPPSPTTKVSENAGQSCHRLERHSNHDCRGSTACLKLWPLSLRLSSIDFYHPITYLLYCPVTMARTGLSIARVARRGFSSSILGSPAPRQAPAFFHAARTVTAHSSVFASRLVSTTSNLRKGLSPESENPPPKQSHPEKITATAAEINIRRWPQM